jgi:hypothetical protein
MAVDIKIPEQQQYTLTPGSTSPQQSALMKMNNMNQTQTALNNAAQGGKRRKKGGGNIEIQPTSTASYNVNGVLKQTATGDITSQVNSVGDKGAFVTGGSKRRKSKRRQTRNSRYKRTRSSRCKRTRTKSRRY